MFQPKSSRLAAAISLGLGYGLSLPAPQALAAAAESASPGPVEVVVVTARKREESLEDVSAAISVIGGDALREGVISDVRDLQYSVPGLTVGETVGAMKITMRSLGNSSNARGEDSQVAFHVDGAVVSRPEAQGLALFDAQRVEVLKGPQGTLYGRNATAGAVNVVTNKPTQALDGYLNVTGGNYQFVNVEAALGGGITDRVAGRIAGVFMDRDGFSKNITTGNDLDDLHRWALRGQVDFQLADSVNWLVSGEYAKERDATGLFTYLTPLYVVNTEQFPPPPSQAPKGLGGLSDPNSRDGAGNIDPIMDRETYSVTSTLTWDINESLTLKDIANYRKLKFYLAQDLDLSSVVPAPGNTATVSIPLDEHQVSNELQLTYQSDKLLLIGGLYYWREVMEATTFVGATPTEGIWFIRDGESDGESWAGFFNATYSLTDMFGLRVGGRYTHDDRAIDSSQVLNGVLTVPRKSPTNPGYDERSNSQYTGEYGLDIHLADNTLLYLTYSQGYQQGAAIIMQINNPIADPTDVANYEIGFKYATPRNDFVFNIDVYSMDIKDLQRTQAIPQPNGTFATIVSNIDGLKTNGVELDTRWSPLDNLNLYLGVTYTDAEFKDFVNDDPLQFGTLLVQLKGNKPQLTPDWKGNIGGEYTFALPNGGGLALGANMSVVTKQFLDEFDRAPMVADGYQMYDARLTYQPNSQHWSVMLWGKNLSDEKEIFDASFSANGRVTSKRFVDPRTYGISFNLKL
jgi:iron complex outermembrane recepter protein